MKIRFLSPAERELDEAYEYYESQISGLGNEFLDEIMISLSRIKKYPEGWPSFSDNTRRCLTNRFPYGIIYLLDTNEIVIVAVAHLHRKPRYWKNRI